jgi:enoyl-CoA hydratase
MNFERIRYETTNDIAYVTLLHDQSDMRLVKELTHVCRHLEDENPCSVVVFQGSNGQFNRGINFAEFKPDTPMDIHGFNKWEKMIVQIERLPKVTISVLEGAVVGGGFQLALATDHRIATPEAYFELPEVKSGFLPGMGVYRLAKYIGIGHAKRLILQGSRISSEEALKLGVVDSITEDIEASIKSAVALFQPIHPIAIQLSRRLLNESFHDSFEDALGHFLAAQHRAISQTAFLQNLKK